MNRRDLLRFALGGLGALAVGRRGVAFGSSASIPWNDLRARLKGTLVDRAAAEFEPLRASMLWNARKTARRPEAIVTVADEADVRTAVKFAREHSLKVAVRGKGHSWCAASLREGGLLLDLSRLNAIEVDASARTASAQPAATNGELVAKLTPLGLAFPVGHCPSVPLSGYLLSGGFGWNAGSWGPACQSVRRIELVTAEGESIVADATRNTDIFWAARGAGAGFFGVVTRYHLDLQVLPRAIRSSTFVYAAKDIERVAAWLPEVVATLRPEVETVAMIAMPPPPAPEPAERVFIVMATAFADTEADARAWLAPLEAGPSADALVRDIAADTPIEALLAMIDGAFPEGHRYAADVSWIDVPPHDFIARVKETALGAPSPQSLFLFGMAGPPRADAPPAPDMAFSMAGKSFVATYGIWKDAADDEKNIAWVRAMSSKLEPVTIGHYVGEADLTVHANRPSRCFAPAQWAKLGTLKKKLDPTDLFYSYPTPG